MGALSIGRVVLSVDDASPRKWNADGESVSFSGWVHAGTVEESTALRAQLLGLAGSLDEPVIPVVSADDATIDGYYRVGRVTVGMLGASLAHGVFSLDVSFVRVPGYSAPQMESSIVAVERPVAAALAINHSLHAAPGSATGYYWPAHGTTDPGVRDTETGDVVFAEGDPAIDAPTTYALFFCPPGDFYVGSPRLVVADNLVVGRQVAATPEDWSFDNGLVRVVPDLDAGVMRLGVDVWGGAAWESYQAWSLTSVLSGQPTVTGFQSLTVLRNGPEETIIRLGCENDADYLGRVYLDISLRRGDRMARCWVGVDSIATWVIEPHPGYTGAMITTTIAAVVYNFGVVKATADADGNRPFVMGGTTFARIDDALQQNDGVDDGYGFGLGAEIDSAGTAFGDGENELDLGLQWFVVQSERLSVVAR